MKNKKIWFMPTLIIVALMSIMFTSCNSDDEDDKKSNTSFESIFLGGWLVSGLEIIFQTEGKICYFSSGVYPHYINGSWQYNEQTNILSTDAIDNNKNYQWMVTMTDDNTWAGLFLYNNQPVSAARLDIKEVAGILLHSSQWESSVTGNIIELDGRIIRSSDGSQLGYIFFDYVSEDLENDVIKIRSSGEFYEIHNPYNSKKIYFQFPSGTKYYPINKKTL